MSGMGAVREWATEWGRRGRTAGAPVSDIVRTYDCSPLWNCHVNVCTPHPRTARYGRTRAKQSVRVIGVDPSFSASKTGVATKSNHAGLIGYETRMFGALKSMAVFVVSTTFAVRTISPFVFAMDSRAAR
jgi:hypothetical protein